VKVRYRPTALQQINDIFKYIAVDDAGAARRVVQAIKSAQRRTRHPRADNQPLSLHRVLCR
jgi:plasmid stabilization system protein ParE